MSDSDERMLVDRVRRLAASGAERVRDSILSGGEAASASLRRMIMERQSQLRESTRYTLHACADLIAYVEQQSTPTPKKKPARPLPNRPIPYTTTDLRGSTIEPAPTDPNRPRAKR